jgi:hypothetical protein
MGNRTTRGRFLLDSRGKEKGNAKKHSFRTSHRYSREQEALTTTILQSFVIEGVMKKPSSMSSDVSDVAFASTILEYSWSLRFQSLHPRRKKTFLL